MVDSLSDENFPRFQQKIGSSFAGVAEFYSSGDWTAPGGKDGGELMADGVRRWTLVFRFFVNFSPFCGDIKPVECPESRVEGRAREMAVKKHKKTRKRNAWRSAFGCAAPG